MLSDPKAKILTKSYFQIYKAIPSFTALCFIVFFTNSKFVAILHWAVYQSHFSNRLRWWLAVLNNKVFVMWVYTLFSYNVFQHLMDYFYMNWETRNMWLSFLWYSLSYGVLEPNQEYLWGMTVILSPTYPPFLLIN